MGYINLDKLLDCEVEFEGQRYVLKQISLAEQIEFENKTKDLDLKQKEDNDKYSNAIFDVVFRAFQKWGNSSITLEGLREKMHFKQAWALYMNLCGRGNLLTPDGELKEEYVKNLIEAVKAKK